LSSTLINKDLKHTSLGIKLKLIGRIVATTTSKSGQRD
jgi:hypothetical protein